MARYALNVWDWRFLSLTGGALSALISLPPEYNDDTVSPKRWPLVFFLHGRGERGSDLETVLRYGVPPVVLGHPDFPFVTISPQLPDDHEWVDYHAELLAMLRYVTANLAVDPQRIYLTGLSMGGHGALFLALRHPDIFGAAGSMSGGVDLRESHNQFDISKRIGDTITQAAAWHDYSVVYLVEKYPSTTVKIIFDCGVDDFFIEGNRHLHRALLQLKIPHEYAEKPGGHSWDYWRQSLSFHLLFFSRYFYPNGPRG